MHHFYIIYYYQKKKNQNQDIFLGKNNWNWKSIWYIIQNMWRWIIHAWRSLLHCIIRTSGWNPLPSHHHCNCIRRRPNYFCLRHIQWLSEYQFNQYWIKSLSEFTTSIHGIVQKKNPNTSISLNKSWGNIHSGNIFNPRKKTCWKILVWLTKINLHHFKNNQNLFRTWFLLLLFNQTLCPDGMRIVGKWCSTPCTEAKGTPDPVP